MKILLDTHILLWWLSEKEKLRADTIGLIKNSENTIFVSTASIWEIYIKESIGKIEIPKNFLTILQIESFKILSIDIGHIEKVRTLENHHKDPFDRVIIAQCLTNKLKLISYDKIFESYQGINSQLL